MNKDELITKKETKEEIKERALHECNPLLVYSTTQLKAELRRRKKEGW